MPSMLERKQKAVMTRLYDRQYVLSTLPEIFISVPPHQYFYVSTLCQHD